MIFTSLLPSVGFLTLALPSIRAQNNPFIPFDTFLKGVQDATYAQWKGTAIESPAAFDEIKAHILSMYDGIGKIRNTFVLDAEYTDCVDILKQPTVRLLGIGTIDIPPSNNSHPKLSQGDGHALNYADSPLKLGLIDRFGNRISCPDNTIPFGRLTLQKLTRFPNLKAFFGKPAGLPSTPDASAQQHDQEVLARRIAEPPLYAYAFERVKNFGGNSWLNLQNPMGDLSLSQQWYVGGTGINTQTVEGGWIVWDNKFATKKAVLFIYSGTTAPCWNLECGAFLQINNNWLLGGPFSHNSVSGGRQWGFEMQWKLYRGNWWLFLKGAGSYEAVGYYPTKVFNGGQLAKNARLVQYGGVVARLDPSHNWPQMGSGALPWAGWTRAAFQKSIFYIPKDESGGVGVWTSLFTAVQGSRKCWDIAYTPSTSGRSWGSYFYFGGPGGSVCT